MRASIWVRAAYWVLDPYACHLIGYSSSKTVSAQLECNVLMFWPVGVMERQGEIQ